MITSVAVYEISCDDCGDDLSAPRAQDHWTSLEEAREAMRERGWTDIPGVLWCNTCSCTHLGHELRPGGRHCNRCWHLVSDPAPRG
jgi:hypothetical protein